MSLCVCVSLLCMLFWHRHQQWLDIRGRLPNNFCLIAAAYKASFEDKSNYNLLSYFCWLIGWREFDLPVGSADGSPFLCWSDWLKLKFFVWKCLFQTVSAFQGVLCNKPTGANMLTGRPNESVSQSSSWAFLLDNLSKPNKIHTKQHI